MGWKGVALVLGSAAAFATAGFWTRMVAADAWTILFWRGVFGSAFIGAVVWAREGRGAAAAFGQIGWAGLAVAACSTLGTVCFINALRRTSVADVMLINATGPFVAAGLGMLVLRERERPATLVAGVVALAGVAWMVGGAAVRGDLLGDALALAMVVVIAAMMVMIRAWRRIDMLPAAALSAFASAMVAAPWARPFDVGGMEFLWLALFGTTQFGLGLLLLTLGSRLVAPARAALLGNAEVPLGPALVWAAFGEVPARETLMGGGLVMLAVVGEVMAGWYVNWGDSRGGVGWGVETKQERFGTENTERKGKASHGGHGEAREKKI